MKPYFLKINLIFIYSYDIIILASKPDNRCRTLYGRGKSELHRAGCWVIPSGGDSKESATEIYRQIYLVRVERRGKSSPAYR